MEQGRLNSPQVSRAMKPESRYVVMEALTEAQVEELHALYQDVWWSKGRSLAEVRTMVEHCDFVFGVVARDSPKLLGFARVISDHVYKAFVFDVIIHPEHRAEGLGTFLMESLMAHPVLSRVRHIELYCLPERVAFYERHGFSADVGEVLLMRRVLGDGAA
jgi:GNAT superfamily N-acetyltransferase